MIRCQRAFAHTTLAVLFSLTFSGCSKPAATPETTPANGDKAPAKTTSKPDRPARQTTRYSGEALTYPRDKDMVLAIVHGRNVTLEHIVDHVDSRHFQGFKMLVSTKLGQRELRIPRMADWVRQYADIEALRAAARAAGVKETDIQKSLAAAFLEAFEQYRTVYEQREQRPFPSTKKGVKAMQDRFLKSRGLGLEVEGLLDALVPLEVLSQAEVNEFYNKFSEAMNGLLNASQIFIQTRDKQTGALLRGEAKKAADAKVEKIRGLLAEDGSNFETIAASYSENQASARRNGRLNNLHRFDPRLPAALCRTVWGLRNGQWAGPILTRFGTHFIKRIEWTITKTIINPDPKNDMIKAFIRSHRQEELLFRTREKAKIQLLY